MRGKRVRLNLMFGMLGQFIAIGLGLIVPRLFIVKLGSETNGMISSINELYSYIQILEAGIGAATIQALYAPVAKNNRKRINEILSATAIYYKRVAKSYLLCMIVCSLGYPLVVNTGLPTWEVAFVFFTSGIGNVVNFWMQGKYKQLLAAEGKVYITTNLTTFVTFLTYAAKIVLLSTGFDIIAIQIANCVISLVPMLFFEIYIRTNYKWIDLHEKPDFSAISQKNAVLTHQISGLVFAHTDVLILTIFCGLKVVSVYTLYNMMFVAFEKIINMLNNSISAELGQLLQTDKKKFENIYAVYELIMMVIPTIICAVLLHANETFIKLYTAGVNDINYIVPFLGLLFAIYKLNMWIRSPITSVVSWAGHYSQTQSKAVGEAIINLGISLLLIVPFGMPGILIGSITATIFGQIYVTIYVGKNIDRQLAKNSTIRMVKMLVAFSIVAMLPIDTYVAVHGYFSLLINACVVGVISSLIIVVIGFLGERKTINTIIKKMKSCI